MADDEDQQTAAYTFRERGLFWWAHEPMLSQHQAPESAVIGELKITSEGRIRLDLDGMLHRERHEPFHTDSEAEYLALRPRRIFGVSARADGASYCSIYGMGLVGTHPTPSRSNLSVPRNA